MQWQECPNCHSSVQSQLETTFQEGCSSGPPGEVGFECWSCKQFLHFEIQSVYYAIGSCKLINVAYNNKLLCC